MRVFVGTDFMREQLVRLGVRINRLGVRRNKKAGRKVKNKIEELSKGFSQLEAVKLIVNKCETVEEIRN